MALPLDLRLYLGRICSERAPSGIGGYRSWRLTSTKGHQEGAAGGCSRRGGLATCILHLTGQDNLHSAGSASLLHASASEWDNCITIGIPTPPFSANYYIVLAFGFGLFFSYTRGARQAR